MAFGAMLLSNIFITWSLKRISEITRGGTEGAFCANF